MTLIEIIYQEVINLLFGLSFRLYLNVLKIKKILQFWDKKFSTCVARLTLTIESVSMIDFRLVFLQVFEVLKM